MVEQVKSNRRLRARGSTGKAKGSRQHQKSSWFRPVPIIKGKKTLIARIYFAVDEHTLGADDRFALGKLARHYQERIHKGQTVHLKFEGYADVRYKEDYNQKLSEKRAQAAFLFVRNLITHHHAFNASFKGFGEKFSGDHWAEDRRVDVFDLEGLFPGYGEKSTYPYDHYFNNQNLFRPMIFKKYHPRWTLWKPLEHLVDQYEVEDGRGGGNLSLQPGDREKIMNLLKKLCTPAELKTIDNNIRHGNEKAEIETAFGVEYRKAYPEAYRRAYEDFYRSDFRYPWEFFSKKFGLVPKDTPYTRRPGSKSAEKLGKEYKVH